MMAAKKLLLGTRAKSRELVVQKTPTTGEDWGAGSVEGEQGKGVSQKKQQAYNKVCLCVYKFYFFYKSEIVSK